MTWSAGLQAVFRSRKKLRQGGRTGRCVHVTLRVDFSIGVTDLSLVSRVVGKPVAGFASNRESATLQFFLKSLVPNDLLDRQVRLTN